VSSAPGPFHSTDGAHDPLRRLDVAIDGPAGSGKSSVARQLAARLGLLHLDTGAMYRSLTLAGRRAGIPPDDSQRLATLLAAADIRFEAGRVRWNGEDVEAAVRSPEVTALVSQVSAHAAVRAAMVDRQRRMAWESQRGVVLEGRDIGTVVLPLARCKVYLDADPGERARRRALQQGVAAEGEPLQELRGQIEQRDALDTRRAVSPLQIAPDAHVVDTTRLSLAEVVARCAELAHEANPVAAAPTRGGVGVGTGLYRLGYLLSRGFSRGLLGGRRFGRGNDTGAGPFLYASNHVSWFDPPIVGALLDREIGYLAKRELFRGPSGGLIRRLNTIPIDRSRWDAEAFRRAEAWLRSGRSLLIFPEGTRRPAGQLGPIKRGLAILVLRSGIPYVPCYIRGSTNLWAVLWRRRRLEVWVGPPVVLRALPTLRERLTEPEIHARIGALYLEQVRFLAALSEAGAR
jgi:cytidylate kinase